jgi:hypothetical protein
LDHKATDPKVLKDYPPAALLAYSPEPPVWPHGQTEIGFHLCLSNDIFAGLNMEKETGLANNQPRHLRELHLNRLQHHELPLGHKSLNSALPPGSDANATGRTSTRIFFNSIGLS